MAYGLIKVWAAVVRPRFHGLDLDWFELGSGYSVRADPDPMDPSSLPNFYAIFWHIFSLLLAAFSLSILVLFLPFSLYLSSLFPSSKFCGLKVSKTTDLRTFRKIKFSDLGYRR